MDKRAVVTAVLCAVAALGASAAMTKVVPADDGKAPAHANTAPPTMSSTGRPSQSQSPERARPSGGATPDRRFHRPHRAGPRRSPGHCSRVM